MTVSTNINVPMDIATRQMSITKFDPSPAGSIEILGIATATCLLAFFLCIIFCAGLQILCHSRYSSSPESSVGHVPYIIKTSGEKDKSRRSICAWNATHLGRPRTFYGEQQDISETPFSARLGCITRMKITRRSNVIPEKHYYTQIPPRCKPVSRKPLSMPNTTINSIKREDTTLDMEEGLSLSYKADTAIPTALNGFTRPHGTATCREPKAKSGEHSNISFLHCRTTSL
ncbi:hypothetical protein F4859DRAFT_57186 [Xylaria cf. heliscus]|nr:hypothetical protein F4859DRAFT_57186 [Xylaria cf. heliscus]